MWDVEFHKDFDSEFAELPETVQDEILALAGVLEKIGHCSEDLGLTR